MISTRRTAATAVDALCRLLGRRRVVRAAHFALRRARLDLPNDPATNGEYALHRWVLAALPPGAPLVVFDVGANVGAWSDALLAQADRSGHREPLRLHAFEPVAQTHDMLLASLPDTVRVNRLALTDRPGEVTMHVVGALAGTNSVHPAATGGPPVQIEVVPATTVDGYRHAERIAHIDLLKIDTEGHDLAVLRGAQRSLAEQAISIVQFEYNHRWVHARHFLKDAFDLMQPWGYRLGKLTPRGMEAYPVWHPELETFVEGNYLACTESSARRLPQVAWWKDPNPRVTKAPR
jgi:FkbM family methyltransferase